MALALPHYSLVVLVTATHNLRAMARPSLLGNDRPKLDAVTLTPACKEVRNNYLSRGLVFPDTATSLAGESEKCR